MQRFPTAVSQDGLGRIFSAGPANARLLNRLSKLAGLSVSLLLLICAMVAGQEDPQPQVDTARVNGRWNGSDKPAPPAAPAAANGVISIKPDTADGSYSITPAAVDEGTRLETLNGAPPQPPAGMLTGEPKISNQIPMTLTAAPNTPSLRENSDAPTAGFAVDGNNPALEPAADPVDPTAPAMAEGESDPTSEQSLAPQFPAPAPAGFGPPPEGFRANSNGFGRPESGGNLTPPAVREFETPTVRSSDLSDNGLRRMDNAPLREQAGDWGSSQPVTQPLTQPLTPPFGGENARALVTPETGSAGFSGSVRTLPGNLPAYSPSGSGTGSVPMSDAQVAPASYLNPSPPEVTQAAQASLDQVRERFQTYAVADQTSLPGQPVPLVEMMLEPLPYPQRRAMVSQYWETYYDWAALVLAQRHDQWLASVRSTNSQADTTLLQLARQVAANRRLAAEIQLGKSQSRLLDFMPNPRPNGFLPLPADQPLISSYRTDFAVYQKFRQLPGSLRGIDEMLPKTLELIRQRAATAASAQYSIQQMAQAAASGQAPMSSVLQAGQIWYDSELALVASVINYNQAIGDYILSVEPTKPPGSLVGLMIGTPASRTTPSNILGNTLPPERQARLPDARSGQSILDMAPKNGMVAPQGFPTTPPGSAPANNGFGQPFGGSPTNRTVPPATINQFPG